MIMATTHTHACQCGDHRVCSKDYCAPGTPAYLDAWLCPDCDLTEKLEALQAVEQHRLGVVDYVLDRMFPLSTKPIVKSRAKQ